MELREAEGEFEVKKKRGKKKKKVGLRSHRRETRRQKLPSAPCAFHLRRALSGGTNPIMSPLGVSEAYSHFNCCCCSALTQAPNYFEAHWSAQNFVAAAHDVTAKKEAPKAK